MNEVLRRSAGGMGALALAAAALPCAAAEILTETGPLPNLSPTGNFAEYQFQWDSSPNNRTFLELDFQLNDGVAAPQDTFLLDQVSYAAFYKPDPSQSNEYIGGCGGFFICNATTSNPAPGLTRIRYETFWGHTPVYVLTPLSPISISFTADFGQDVGPAPYTATYRILAIPEPQGWALMILGFAGAGAALRRSRAPGCRSAQG